MLEHDFYPILKRAYVHEKCDPQTVQLYFREQFVKEFEYYVRLYQIYFEWQRNNRNEDFYMESFPVLAFLYHYDEELLLEHFQTVGIHEGRQGSKDFNVAAYQKNCKKELRDAFGDHYECYYFYWMLNQDSQKGVTTSGKSYPLQLGVKMTSMQAEEFEKVNEYRADVGIAPLEFESELVAAPVIGAGAISTKVMGPMTGWKMKQIGREPIT